MPESKLRRRCDRCNQFDWEKDLEESNVSDERLCRKCIEKELEDETNED